MRVREALTLGIHRCGSPCDVPRHRGDLAGQCRPDAHVGSGWRQGYESPEVMASFIAENEQQFN